MVVRIDVNVCIRDKSRLVSDVDATALSQGVKGRRVWRPRSRDIHLTDLHFQFWSHLTLQLTEAVRSTRIAHSNTR